MARILQGSIDGPHLLNLFINDFIYNRIINYTDDNSFIIQEKILNK